jgi:hypothetical protein
MFCEIAFGFIVTRSNTNSVFDKEKEVFYLVSTKIERLPP